MWAHGQQKSWNPVSISLWVYKTLSSLILFFFSFMRSQLCPSTSFRRTCEVKLWKSMNFPSNRYLLAEWEGRTGKYLAWGHGVRTERSSFWPKSWDLYSKKVVSVRISQRAVRDPSRAWRLFPGTGHIISLIKTFIKNKGFVTGIMTFGISNYF